MKGNKTKKQLTDELDELRHRIGELEASAAQLNSLKQALSIVYDAIDSTVGGTTALERIRTLRGLVPICASCKKIRDDKGFWHQVEVYIRDHSDAELSHSLCPDCAKQLYPGYANRASTPCQGSPE